MLEFDLQRELEKRGQKHIPSSNFESPDEEISKRQEKPTSKIQHIKHCRLNNSRLGQKIIKAKAK